MNSIEEMRLNSKDLKPVFFEEIYKLVKKNSFIQLKPLMKKEIRDIGMISMDDSTDITSENSITDLDEFPTQCDKNVKKKNLISIKKKSSNSFNDRHLIILVHGFQGSSHDVRLIRNN